MSEETISLKDAVGRRLAADLATNPELASQLESDPSSVVKPLIAELIGDDGDLDLSNVTTTVHIETGDNLHFVVTPEAADLDEVAGFGIDSTAGILGSVSIGIDAIGLSGIKKSTETKRCTNEGDGVTRGCCLGSSPDSTTHKNCSSSLTP